MSARAGGPSSHSAGPPQGPRSLCSPWHMGDASGVRSRDVIKALEADGWRQIAQRGSHVQFKHPTKPGRVTVPHPERDIPKGTLRSIEKQAGIALKG